MFINVKQQGLNNNSYGRLIRFSYIDTILESTNNNKAIIVFKKGNDYPNIPDLYTDEDFYSLTSRLEKLGYCI